MFCCFLSCRAHWRCMPRTFVGGLYLCWNDVSSEKEGLTAACFENFSWHDHAQTWSFPCRSFRLPRLGYLFLLIFLHPNCLKRFKNVINCRWVEGSDTEQYEHDLSVLLYFTSAMLAGQDHMLSVRSLWTCAQRIFSNQSSCTFFLLFFFEALKVYWHCYLHKVHLNMKMKEHCHIVNLKQIKGFQSFIHNLELKNIKISTVSNINN